MTFSAISNEHGLKKLNVAKKQKTSAFQALVCVCDGCSHVVRRRVRWREMNSETKRHKSLRCCQDLSLLIHDRLDLLLGGERAADEGRSSVLSEG